MSSGIIASEHVLGATIWAYGAGGARVQPWESPDHYSLCRRAL